MWNRKFVSILALALVSFSTIAGVKVAGLDLALSRSRGAVNISMEGRSSELPDLKVTGKTIEITLDKADAFNTITKNVYGANLTAIHKNGKAVILAVLPYEVPAAAVNLGWKNNTIEVLFPRGHVNKAAAPELGVSAKEVLPPKEETVAHKVARESLNEDYLNGLMKDNAHTEVSDKKVEKDEVKVQQAAVTTVAPEAAKTNSDNFSFAGYAAKFTIFLAMVLGLFYGIVQLLKKGVFTRGKLGFLNNAQMIEVLSTTYVAPKRSLMVIRAHKQIFLVANSETGLTFLSEMKDTSGLIKEGEKFVTGTNFDTNLSDAQTNEIIGSYKLKEDILESAPLPPDTGLAKLANAKDDIVKFSEELKKKAKKLRPIENRAN